MAALSARMITPSWWRCLVSWPLEWTATLSCWRPPLRSRFPTSALWMERYGCTWSNPKSWLAWRKAGRRRSPWPGPLNCMNPQRSMWCCPSAAVRSTWGRTAAGQNRLFFMNALLLVELQKKRLWRNWMSQVKNTHPRTDMGKQNLQISVSRASPSSGEWPMLSWGTANRIPPGRVIRPAIVAAKFIMSAGR